MNKTLELRDYQRAVVNEVVSCLIDKNQQKQQLEQLEQTPEVKEKLAKLKADNILLQLPTGAGKTIIATQLVDMFSKQGISVFFIVHRKELVEQTSDTFSKYGLEHGIISANILPRHHRLIQVCSVQTLVNRITRIDKPEKMVIIWDECHHIAAGSYKKIFEYYYRAFSIGLSATPRRLDGAGLGNFFDRLCTLSNVIKKYFDPEYSYSSVRWLIDRKNLSDYRLFAVPSVNRDDIDTVGGKFVIQDASNKMNNNIIAGQIVETWKKHALGLKTIAFAVDVGHAIGLSDSFNYHGVSATYVTGKCKNRSEKLQSFAEGAFDVVVNVGLFDEGFDIAAASGLDVTVKCVISAAPTKSLSRWLQMCGRALRPSKCGRKAIILDHAQNSYKFGQLVHGSPDADKDWSLTKNEAKEVGVAICDECHFAYKIVLKSCPECGAARKKQERDGNKSITEIDDLELVEITKQAEQEAQNKKKKKLLHCKTVEEIQKIKRMSISQAVNLLKNNKIKTKKIKHAENLIKNAITIYQIKLPEYGDLELKTTPEIDDIISKIEMELCG
ncbi:MAG: DEAD/DEAH box helicase [Mesoflavibacter sp.]|nr:DEAD/DEAH box helicase [Mesoflavibacter sp.]